jgi:ADP-ribose pyrophosphatase YjhB (NUDIX family)
MLQVLIKPHTFNRLQQKLFGCDQNTDRMTVKPMRAAHHDAQPLFTLNIGRLFLTCFDPRLPRSQPQVTAAMSTPGKPHTFARRVPAGDTHERDVCDHCGFIAYENPKLVAGAVVGHEGHILLCRRAIEPRIGYWTLPAGYMELNETTAQAATREAREEACADIRIDALLAVYSIPRISQVQIIYRATLVDPSISAGDESLEVALFDWSDIPWSEIAFPSVHWALNHHREVSGKTVFAPFSNPQGDGGNAMPAATTDTPGL